MKFDKCINAISELTGKELSDSDKKQIAKTVGQLIEKMDKEGKAGDLTEQLMPLLDQYIKDLKTAALIEKRNAALNVLKRSDSKNYLKSVWGDDLEQGIRSFFQGSQTPRQGSRNSLDVAVSTKKNQYKMGLTSRLANEGVLDFAQSGKFDDQIYQAMYELSKKKPNQDVIGKLTPEAVKVGKAINDSLEIARLEANKHGANIGKLEGRVLKRTHDPDKLGLAAGKDKPIGDVAHKKAWIDFVSQRIDWEKTMPDLPEAKRAKALDDMYNRLVSGNHLDLEKMDGTPTGFKGPTNVAKKMSQERVLHFKDGKMEFEYYKQFSRGDTLLGNAIQELDFDGTNVAIMQKMGPNAKANLDRVVDELIVELRDSGRIDEMKALRKEYDAISKSTWPIITNEINAVSLGTWGKFSTITRKSQRASDLMMAAISSTGDFLSVAGTSRYANNRSAGEYFSSLHKTITNVFGNFKKITPEMIETAKAMNIILETTLPTSASKFDADFKDPGALSKFLDWTFKFNGIQALQDRIRLSAVLIQGEKYSGYVGKSFDQLPVGTQSWFKQFDISPKEWDLMRGMELKEGSNGLKYLVVDTVNDIPLEKFDTLESVANSKNKEQARLKAREELRDKFGRSNHDLAAMSATEASAADQRIITWGGTRAGTPAGEIARHVMMYKSFMITLMRKHLGREIYGYNEHRGSLSKMMLDSFTRADQGGGFLAAMIPSALALGYVNLTLKDMLKGKAPREPKDWKDVGAVMSASMLQTGALGIYGDFLFGDMKSRFGRSFVETLAGPTFGRVGEAIDIAGSIKELPFSDDFDKDVEKTRNKVLNFGLNNTPGVSSLKNHFATKLAFDYMITYNLHEMMNPGYLKKMEKKLKKEKQQEYLLPPSSVIDRGGGFK